MCTQIDREITHDICLQTDAYESSSFIKPQISETSASASCQTDLNDDMYYEVLLYEALKRINKDEGTQTGERAPLETKYLETIQMETPSAPTTPERNVTKHSQILLIGDRSIKEWAHIIKKTKKDMRFNTNSKSICNSNTEIIDKGEKLSNFFSLHDYVILMMTNLDIINRHSLRKVHLDKIRRIAQKTHLIIISSPPAHESKVALNRLSTNRIHLYATIYSKRNKEYLLK